LAGLVGGAGETRAAEGKDRVARRALTAAGALAGGANAAAALGPGGAGDAGDVAGADPKLIHTRADAGAALGVDRAGRFQWRTRRVADAPSTRTPLTLATAASGAATALGASLAARG